MKNESQGRLDSGLDSRRNEFISVLNHFGFFKAESKYKIICPFHPDVNASMLIDLDSARFFCFGCGKKGGTLDFIKFSYPDKNSFERASTLHKIIKGSEVKPGMIRRASLKKKNINSIKDYYYNLPKLHWDKVQLNSGTDASKVKQYLRKRGFTSKALNEVGAKANENKWYPIIFPMMDNNVFRGYVCRTMDPATELKRKYLYNTGFRRANTLAGTYGETDTVLMVEGYMDMVKAVQMGVTQVVAILGWKISEKQVSKLKKKGIKHIVCALDADKAGRKGYKYLEGLNAFKVSKIYYPKGAKDFGDLTKKQFNERVIQQIKRVCKNKILKETVKNG